MIGSQFAIKLKVESELKDGQPADLDVDHIRFAPMAHDFKATVYDLENETACLDNWLQYFH